MDSVPAGLPDLDSAAGCWWPRRWQLVECSANARSPAADGGQVPDLPAAKRGDRCGKIWPGLQLKDSLPAHADQVLELSGSYEPFGAH